MSKVKCSFGTAFARQRMRERDMVPLTDRSGTNTAGARHGDPESSGPADQCRPEVAARTADPRRGAFTGGCGIQPVTFGHPAPGPDRGAVRGRTAAGGGP